MTDENKLQEQYDTLKEKSLEIANQRDFYKGQFTNLLGELRTVLTDLTPIVEKYTEAEANYQPWKKPEDDTEATE